MESSVYDRSDALCDGCRDARSDARSDALSDALPTFEHCLVGYLDGCGMALSPTEYLSLTMETVCRLSALRRGMPELYAAITGAGVHPELALRDPPPPVEEEGGPRRRRRGGR